MLSHFWTHLEGKVGWLFSSMIAVFQVASFIVTTTSMHRNWLWSLWAKILSIWASNWSNPPLGGSLLQDQASIGETSRRTSILIARLWNWIINVVCRIAVFFEPFIWTCFFPVYSNPSLNAASRSTHIFIPIFEFRCDHMVLPLAPVLLTTFEKFYDYDRSHRSQLTIRRIFYCITSHWLNVTYIEESDFSHW
jgi:hypothetical protein